MFEESESVADRKVRGMNPLRRKLFRRKLFRRNTDRRKLFRRKLFRRNTDRRNSVILLSTISLFDHE